MPRILVVDDNPELLALLSSAFEEAGYVVQTAQRGRAAIDLAKKERPDLAIIDVLLPDVMGFDVGEALHKQKIPVAFMSGVHKGGKAASNAIYKYGAVGYFEKPFERKALLALVEQLVPARPAQPGQIWDVEAAPGVEGPSEAMELTGSIDLNSGGTSARIQGAALNLRAGEAEKKLPSRSSAGSRPQMPLAPPVMTPSAAQQQAVQSVYVAPKSFPPEGDRSFEIDLENGPGTVSQTAITRPIAAAPTRPIASEQPVSKPPLAVAPAATPSAPPPPPIEALAENAERGSVHRGAIDDNLPQLFAAFLAAQETGELGLSRGQIKKIVYFEKGMPVFALSNLVAERLGQFLVRAGKIDEETLKHALQEAEDTEQRTGDVLILMGLLTEQERLYYVGQQIKSILYSLFAWTDGQYQLSFADRARKETIKLDIHPATLVLRGVKKLYKPERLEKILAMDDRPTPGGDPLFSLSDVELQGWEALMVARCDGTRTVRELLKMTAKPELEALGTLVALVSMRILEKRR